MRLMWLMILWVLLRGCVAASAELPTAEPSVPSSFVPIRTVRATAIPSATLMPRVQATETPTSQPATTTVLVRSVSPDGLWEAVTESVIQANGSGETVTLVVRSLADSRAWVVETLSEPWRVVAAPWPLYWSRDGHTLYITHRVIRADGCFGPESSNGTDLLAWDERTGTARIILEESGGWLALSPDEQMLAYVTSWPSRLVLRDVVSGEDRAVGTELFTEDQTPATLTDLIWSPDQERIASTARLQSCGDEAAEQRAILVFDVQELEQRVVWQGDQSFHISGWNGDNCLTLVDETGEAWQLEIATGVLAPAR